MEMESSMKVKSLRTIKKQIAKYEDDINFLLAKMNEPRVTDQDRNMYTRFYNTANDKKNILKWVIGEISKAP